MKKFLRGSMIALALITLSGQAEAVRFREWIWGFLLFISSGYALQNSTGHIQGRFAEGPLVPADPLGCAVGTPYTWQYERVGLWKEAYPDRDETDELIKEFQCGAKRDGRKKTAQSTRKRKKRMRRVFQRQARRRQAKMHGDVIGPNEERRQVVSYRRHHVRFKNGTHVYHCSNTHGPQHGVAPLCKIKHQIHERDGWPVCVERTQNNGLCLEIHHINTNPPKNRRCRPSRKATKKWCKDEPLMNYLYRGVKSRLWWLWEELCRQ